MSRTVVTSQEVFTFSELGPEAQQKAIDNRVEEAGQDWSGQWLINQWKEKLEGMGFEDVQISYSGFSSQGDGASFTAKQFDLCHMLKAFKLIGKVPNLYRKFKEYDCFSAHHCHVRRICNHYSHYNTVKVEIEEYGSEHAQQELARELLTEAVRNLCKDLYNELEAAYDDATSEARAREWLEEEEGEEFLENGERHY